MKTDADAKKRASADAGREDGTAAMVGQVPQVLPARRENKVRRDHKDHRDLRGNKGPRESRGRRGEQTIS